MLSPAQPSPSAQRPAGRGKKCIIFRIVFRQRYSRTVKSCCSKIEKIKLLDPPDFQWKSLSIDDFSSQIERQKINTPVLQWVTKARFAPWLLDDFFMFFACFLTHCKTGVLIFWRSIWMKNHVIFACFSRAFWLIARPRCWFFDGQYRRKIVLFSCVFRVLSDRLQDRRVDFFVLRGASGSSTLRTT